MLIKSQAMFTAKTRRIIFSDALHPKPAAANPHPVAAPVDWHGLPPGAAASGHQTV